MKKSRILWHLIRADLLERARRNSFLLVLGATIYLGYAVVAGHIVMRLIVQPTSTGAAVSCNLADHVEQQLGYRGVYNSAWVGMLTAFTTTVFLSLAGFFIVKNTLQRDRRTGVGEIVATTPISRLLYIVGKTMSNLTLLAIVAGIMVLAAAAMQVVYREHARIALGPLVSPYLLVWLPAMALVSAMAVLFETLPGLRGGFGNAVYALLWVFCLSLPAIFSTPLVDWLGYDLLQTTLQAALQPIVPYYHFVGLSFEAGAAQAYPWQCFLWKGIPWNLEVVGMRLYWVGVALALLTIAVFCFDRFDPARKFFRRRDRRRPSKTKRLPVALPISLDWARRTPTRGSLQPTSRRATTVRRVSIRSSCFGRLLAELRLALMRPRWWWHLIALGLIVAGLFSPLDTSRRYLLPAAWIWPLSLWSAMGVREARHRTRELVFCAAHPLRRQLPATWLAGVVVAIVTGSGVALRLLQCGRWSGLLAWATGTVFVPTLALALGCWSNSSKPFEVLYALLWYFGPIEGMPSLDFMGASVERVSIALSLCYLGLTTILLALAFAGRKRQLQV
jgi:hypothetical protein